MCLFVHDCGLANWPCHPAKEVKVEKVVGGAVVDLPVAVLETYQSWEEVVRRDLGGRLVNVSALRRKRCTECSCKVKMMLRSW